MHIDLGDSYWFLLQIVFTSLLFLAGLLLVVRTTASRFFVVESSFVEPNDNNPPMSLNDSCVVCGEFGPRQCSGCKLVRYCSETCQKSHWRSGHKVKCKDDRKGNSRVKRTGIALPLIPGGSKKLKKILFPYDEFVRLYNWDTPGFPPCGLLNCGNSCFANVVLQCLFYTRPLVAYLLRKGHRRECRRNDWCFLCELEIHVERASRSFHAFSPINILSRLPNIGGNLGYGKQEDAHEFMRFAIDTMQSICLDEFGGEKAVHPGFQETTLIQHIFAGRLQSQVTCSECNKLSVQFENMMDLTVEIHGDAASLEECLDQFTARECLNGDNMYKCDGCNDYVLAWKRLTVHQAPNILTIALKRFQSGRFGKLNKRVAFPETLDFSPYMSKAGDRSNIYKLYAVVVHVDMLNASFFGHYICYTKDFSGNWYRIDDCKVAPVDLDEVLSQGAYMLMYSRVCARQTCLNQIEESLEVGTQKICQEMQPSSKATAVCLPEAVHADSVGKFGPSVSNGTVVSKFSNVEENLSVVPVDLSSGVSSQNLVSEKHEASSGLSAKCMPPEPGKCIQPSCVTDNKVRNSGEKSPKVKPLPLFRPGFLGKHPQSKENSTRPVKSVLVNSFEIDSVASKNLVYKSSETSSDVSESTSSVTEKVAEVVHISSTGKPEPENGTQSSGVMDITVGELVRENCSLGQSVPMLIPGFLEEHPQTKCIVTYDKSSTEICGSSVTNDAELTVSCCDTAAEATHEQIYTFANGNPSVNVDGYAESSALKHELPIEISGHESATAADESVLVDSTVIHFVDSENLVNDNGKTCHASVSTSSITEEAAETVLMSSTGDLDSEKCMQSSGVIDDRVENLGQETSRAKTVQLLRPGFLEDPAWSKRNLMEAEELFLVNPLATDYVDNQNLVSKKGETSFDGYASTSGTTYKVAETVALSSPAMPNSEKGVFSAMDGKSGKLDGETSKEKSAPLIRSGFLLKRPRRTCSMDNGKATMEFDDSDYADSSLEVKILKLDGGTSSRAKSAPLIKPGFLVKRHSMENGKAPVKVDDSGYDDHSMENGKAPVKVDDSGYDDNCLDVKFGKLDVGTSRAKSASLVRPGFLVKSSRRTHSIENGKAPVEVVDSGYGDNYLDVKFGKLDGGTSRSKSAPLIMPGFLVKRSRRTHSMENGKVPVEVDDSGYDEDSKIFPLGTA